MLVIIILWGLAFLAGAALVVIKNGEGKHYKLTMLAITLLSIALAYFWDLESILGLSLFSVSLILAAIGVVFSTTFGLVMRLLIKGT